MKNRIIAGVHIVFWILVTFLSGLQIITIQDQGFLKEAFVRFMVATLFHGLIFYFFYFFVGPLLMSRKRILLFLFFLFCFVAVYSVPVAYVFPLLVKLMLKSMKEVPLRYLYVSVLSSQFLFALFGAMFRIMLEWFRSTRRQQELEKQNIANELALLRSQINPHFLFNTLNNIHSYVYRDQDKTAFGIIKLSEIMRYMLYESNVEKIELEREIDYIKNYIALQKMRLKDPDYVQFTVEGNIFKKMIPPMLLITFVENAFKYCRKKSEGPAINIHLRYIGPTLSFSVTNRFTSGMPQIPENKGFGLNNIRRRLDLIYHDSYRLDIANQKETYRVELTIEDP